jgi:metacaspase-1
VAKGRSLHIGIEEVDPLAYEGRYRGKTHGAAPDARSMREIAERQGYAATLLLTGDATRDAVLAWLRDARTLSPEHMLLVTYAGHGARFRDADRHEEEDGRDESWCLFDGYLLDDEIHDALSQLPAGMRVLVVSDSCYSGTIIRDGFGQGSDPAIVVGETPYTEDTRAMPPFAAAEAYNRRRAFYEPIYSNLRAHRTGVTATVLLLAACTEDTVAYDTREHGKFTAALLEAWDEGRFTGSHEELRAAIASRIAPQLPVLFRVGTPNPEFDAARPFTI